MTFTYIQTEDALWTTGHYDPSGMWHPDRDCGSPEYAAARVAWLNGSGENPDTEREWRLRMAANIPLVQPEAVPFSFVEALTNANRGVESKLRGEIASLTEENANLRQECAELHELIAVQRAEIETLQRKYQRERMSAMRSAGAAALIRAIHSTRTRTHQPIVRVGQVGGGA